MLNWRELPLKTAAVLASGLSQESRCFRKLHHQKLSAEQAARLMMIDELRLIRWLHTKDAEKGKNRPGSVLQLYLEQEKKPSVTSFRTAEEFEARRKKIIAGE